MNNSEHISKDTEGDAGAAGSTPVPDFSDPIDPSWVQPPTAEKRLSNKAVCEVVRQADRCGHEIFWVTPEELICISEDAAAPHWMEAQDAFLDTDPRVLLKDLIAVAARAGRAVTKISFSVGVEGSWRLVAERAGRGATEVKAESQQRDAA